MPKVPPLPPPVTVDIGFFLLTSTIISLVFPLLLCLTLCFVYGRPRGAAPSSKEARPPSSPGRARISSSDIRVDLRAPDKAAAAPKDNPFFPSAMEDAAAMDEVVIDSEWSGTTAGGCPNYATWTNNPTFVLARKAKTSRAVVTITLSQAPQPDGTIYPVGVLVLKLDKLTPKTKLTNAMMLAQIQCSREQSVTTGEIELNVPAKGLLVVPLTFEPGKEASFRLTLQQPADAPLSLARP